MSTAFLLSGSPRAGGNTDDCVDFLDSEFTNAGWETNTLHIRDVHIKPCRGCRACMSLKHCAIQDDDFEEIWEQMRNSDLVIMAAPVYWHGPPSQMKAFIDRTHGYFVVRSSLSGVKAALLSVAGDDGCWESHERILGCIGWFGASVLPPCRILAREKGEALASEDNRLTLESWAEDLISMVKP